MAELHDGNLDAFAATIEIEQAAETTGTAWTALAWALVVVLAEIALLTALGLMLAVRSRVVSSESGRDRGKAKSGSHESHNRRGGNRLHGVVLCMGAVVRLGLNLQRATYCGPCGRMKTWSGW
ncbi:hypothetical protein WH87_16480 [Devosia epidermidihirudinis]|uniref:Uncharacterized protein n=1 Tax=Devosia epidermidihirudinis TaxID=1293439 RepID=A0A0F5Q442_9HYPH|nr:hypothetical protein WH87_16480 [Devosia epidermidihirudinis]